MHSCLCCCYLLVLRRPSATTSLPVCSLGWMDCACPCQTVNCWALPMVHLGEHLTNECVLVAATCNNMDIYTKTHIGFRSNNIRYATKVYGNSTSKYNFLLVSSCDCWSTSLMQFVCDSLCVTSNHGLSNDSWSISILYGFASFICISKATLDN